MRSVGRGGVGSTGGGVVQPPLCHCCPGVVVFTPVLFQVGELLRGRQFFPALNSLVLCWPVSVWGGERSVLFSPFPWTVSHSPVSRRSGDLGCGLCER